MSNGLRNASNSGEPYLQSPLDDIESFFWVSVWAAAYNLKHSHQLSRNELLWREELSGSVSERRGAAMQLLEVEGSEGSPILVHFRRFIRALDQKLRNLRVKWEKTTRDLVEEGKGNDDSLNGSTEKALTPTSSRPVTDLAPQVSRVRVPNHLCFFGIGEGAQG